MCSLGSPPQPGTVRKCSTLHENTARSAFPAASEEQGAGSGSKKPWEGASLQEKDWGSGKWGFWGLSRSHG